jgi:hypothetical protein
MEAAEPGVRQALRAAMASVTISAPDLDMVAGGPSSTFTIGDIGDRNVRESSVVRFDIYRFDKQR